MRNVACSIGVISLALAALAGCSGGSPARTGEASSGVRWAPTLPGALERARVERKLVMVDLATDWCAACKEFDRTTLADPRVVAALGRVVPLRLDAEREGRELAERAGVDGYPTILFLDGRGEEVGRISGLLPAGPFLEELGDVLSRGVR